METPLQDKRQNGWKVIEAYGKDGEILYKDGKLKLQFPGSEPIVWATDKYHAKMYEKMKPLIIIDLSKHQKNG